MMDQLSYLHDFHFIRPHWLWAIIPLLAIVGLTRHIQKQQSGWQTVLANHLYQHLMTSEGAKKTRPPLFLLALAWIIATLALAGPTWERLPQPVYQLNTGKVVLIDMSLSMRATDVTPDRLTRAKYKAIDLVNAITEGETGLVAYAGDAFTISPLSSDAQNLTTLIPSLTPEIMPIAGSDPALGLQSAIELLTNAGYQQGEIFWITDGVENQQMQEVSEILNNSLYRLSILAVGTEEGAPIQLNNGELLKDSRGAIVIPKLTTSNLNSIAKSAGGRYAPMQADDSDINYLIDQSLIEQNDDQEENEKQGDKENFGDKWQEMGPYLLLILLPIAAYAFRRGIITVIFAAFLLPVYTPSAQADWWQDMWKTDNQQAMQSYKKTDYEKAAEKFNDPMWQGNAHYKNKNYEEALKSYSQIDSPQALYNMGNTLAQMQELDKAIAAYEQVLAQQPDHEDALTNKALLEKLKQQQEQQNQDQSDGEQGDQSDQDQQQDGENQQGDQQEQDGESQQGEQQEQQQDGQEQQQDGQDSQSEQNQEQEEQQGAQNEQTEEEQNESEEQQAAQQNEEETENQSEQEQQAQAMQGQEEELTDEQKEQMQRMQTLLNRVPDDPAFLLKRKMQIEAQRRKRERLPTNIQGNW
ncbi:vWA domain-containing protein [Paraglaciecola sp.]|uniref:vWA domain-containing protein n=1 Tax=Paraglaciecola sp. TaxID=1920173 RepID=UPI003EF57525